MTFKSAFELCVDNSAYWGYKDAEYQTFSGGIPLHTRPRSEQGSEQEGLAPR